MNWKIEFYNNRLMKSIQDWPTNMKAKFTWITELIEKNGPYDIGMPHIKSLGKGLMEIRVKSNEGIARAIFCTTNNQTIIILSEFIKKTQKMPHMEMDLAIKRMKEILKK